MEEPIKNARNTCRCWDTHIHIHRKTIKTKLETIYKEVKDCSYEKDMNIHIIREILSQSSVINTSTWRKWSHVTCAKLSDQQR